LSDGRRKKRQHPRAHFLSRRSATAVSALAVAENLTRPLGSNEIGVRRVIGFMRAQREQAMDELDVGQGALLKGKALEDAAVAYVTEYERRHGRTAIDRRYQAGFPGDIESPPRIIEIKSTATSYRGWFLPLQPIQVEHALTDPAFYVYVVEHIGAGGDPSKITLRILGAEHLQKLAAAAIARTSYEVPWPTADYDGTPVEGRPPSQPVGIKPPAVKWPVPAVAPSLGPDSDIAWAIDAALRRLGGEGTITEITAAIEVAHPGRWRDISVALADHTSPGSGASQVPPERRILSRVSRGRYRLR
jgi:hypothetical protein